MKIILLDNRFFREFELVALYKAVDKEKYIVLLVTFPSTDFSMIKIIST